MSTKLNIEINDEAYWEFQKLKANLRADNNGDLLEKLIAIGKRNSG